jgi:hypothetical protein
MVAVPGSKAPSRRKSEMDALPKGNCVILPGFDEFFGIFDASLRGN